MPYTSKNRICSVISPLGEDVLHLRELRGREAISEPFHFELTLFSEKPDVAFETLVGRPLCLRMSLDGSGERFIHGRVARFAQSVVDGRFTTYHATLVPWLWLLRSSSDCRIFQHRTVPQILTQVFDGVGCVDFELDLAGSYEPREYVVQYRETDFDFASRLMEDAGLSYYFRHDEKAHKLVVFDASSRAKACPGQAQAAYATGRETDQKTGAVERMHFEREFRPGRYTLTDYNFADPSLDLRVDTKTRIAATGNERFELYDYPGSYRSRNEGVDLVRLRMEEEESRSQRSHGYSTCEAFTPGYRFELKGHYRPSFDVSYLLTSVEHEIGQAEGASDGTSQHYENRFTCIPHALPWRTPRRTPRPRIHGVQTAVVVGEPGKEIDIDEQGRVYVQFHWDRLGRRDANSSCRVRVSQPGAGKGFGGFFAPRIGQEVIVEFLEGDPDRPLITGRVYNGEQVPPYGDGAHGGVKSRSTPGGAASNFNEIRLEDKKGSELFFVQAERDQTIAVKNDRADSVGNDETVGIGRDRRAKIGNDHVLSIGNDRTLTVGNNQMVSVGANQTTQVGSNHSESVGASETLSVAVDRNRSVGASETVLVKLNRTHTVGVNEAISVGAAQEVTVGAARMLTVGGAQATQIGLAHSVSVGLNQSVQVGGSQSTSVSRDHKVDVGASQSVQVARDASLKVGKTYVVDAGDELQIKVGSAKIVLKKNGEILIDGAKLMVKTSGDITLKGRKVHQN